MNEDLAPRQDPNEDQDVQFEEKPENKQPEEPEDEELVKAK